MIRPRSKDIGRKVVYRPWPGSDTLQEGTITGINPDYIFVQYDGEKFSKATRRESLEWPIPCSPGPEPN